MQESIQTMADALQHLKNMKKNTNCICNVFNCPPDAISESQFLQKGFGSEVLVDCGRELIVQKQIEDAGVDFSLMEMSSKYCWRIFRFVKNIIYLFGGIFCVFLYSSCGEDNLEIIDISNQDGCIVIVPDIQYYTNDKSKFKYLDAIVDFCNEKKNNISFLLQTGDVTNNNHFEQWNNSYQRFFSKLPKVFPIVFCLGNHDYYGNNGSASKRESNCPSELTPVSDVVMPTSLWDNYLKYVTLDNKRMAVLSLEFAPRNITLEWADKVIKDNKDIPIIILTHAFLNNSGKMFDSSDPNCDNKYSQKYYTMSKDYLNDSKEIFDKIIYNNPNVKMVVCGHCVSKNYIECLEKKNVNNENVYCIMVNYQHYKNGGSGNIGLLLYNQGCFELRSFNTESRLWGDVKISFDLTI